MLAAAGRCETPAPDSRNEHYRTLLCDGPLEPKGPLQTILLYRTNNLGHHGGQAAAETRHKPRPRRAPGSPRLIVTTTREPQQMIYWGFTGNSKDTCLLVSFLYTAAKVSSLVSTLTWSVGFRCTLISLEPSVKKRVRLPTISVG